MAELELVCLSSTATTYHVLGVVHRFNGRHFGGVFDLIEYWEGCGEGERGGLAEGDPRYLYYRRLSENGGHLLHSSQLLLQQAGLCGLTVCFVLYFLANNSIQSGTDVSSYFGLSSYVVQL